MVTVVALDNRRAASYQLRLPTFEGPLDVLLRLVEREQLPITEISLIQVADQFLEAAAEIGQSQPESVAEFAAIGSRLVAMKARSLLPRPGLDDSAEADGRELVVQLVEYRAIKQAAAVLAEVDRAGRVAFAKSEVAVLTPERRTDMPLGKHQPAQLSRAIVRRLSVRHLPRAVVLKPLPSLRAMMDRLLQTVAGRSITFREASYRAAASPDEVRALFVAMLVLVRRNVVSVSQAAPFTDIVISRREGAAPLHEADIEEFA